MTDANLMDADCIHGVTWWECKECAALTFYADPESYFAIAILADRPSGPFADDIGCVLMNGEHDHRHGRTARKALGFEWWGTEPCTEMLDLIKEREANS